MSITNDYENVSEENISLEEKSVVAEGDLPLEKLLILSKSFKMDVEENLNKFKEEQIPKISEESNNLFTISDQRSNDILNCSEKQLHNKPEVNSNVMFWEKNYKILGNLEENLKILLNSSNNQHNINQFKPEQEVKELSMYMSNIKDKISKLNKILNSDQTNDQNSNNLQNIFEVENKCQYWIDKYNELHKQYFQLETKCVLVEKENCNYQIEISRVKTIENENLCLNKKIDKSYHVRKELETALESCHEIIYKYQTDIESARNKVKEAVEVVEKTCSEKEQLANDLKKSNEEITRLENELKNLVQESGTKVSLEVEKIKTMYKDRLREANVEIESLQTEKQIVLNKTQQISKEYELLTNKYTSITQKFINEPDIHFKKMTHLIQKIKEYEVAFDNLTTDVEMLKETNRKLQNSYSRKKTKYMMEITFLKDTTKSLENHLNKAINEISEDKKNLLNATDKIKSLEMEISKLKRPEDDFEQKNMQIKELKRHVEAHKQMFEMWRIEMHNMIEGFKYKLNQLKKKYKNMYKNNVKQKQIINNLKTNNSKKVKKIESQKNKKLNISSASTSS